jgi:hypothetical protein
MRHQTLQKAFGNTARNSSFLMEVMCTELTDDESAYSPRTFDPLTYCIVDLVRVKSRPLSPTYESQPKASSECRHDTNPTVLLDDENKSIPPIDKTSQAKIASPVAADFSSRYLIEVDHALGSTTTFRMRTYCSYLARWTVRSPTVPSVEFGGCTLTGAA